MKKLFIFVLHLTDDIDAIATDTIISTYPPEA